ncbi:MAG: hypothetical protein ACQKBT_02540, partial [Puniceicoccales bacterium]
SGPKMLAAVDMISVRSEWEREACVLDHTLDYRPLVQRCRELGKDGKRYLPLMEPRVGKEWPETMVDEFRMKTAITGYPLLDGVQMIDREEVIRRRGLDPDRPIIGIWSTPTLGRGFYGTWDQVFAQPDWFRFRYRAVRGYGCRGLGIPYCNERTVLQQIRAFADRQNAQVVVKLRHYQGSKESLFSAFSDAVVTEDNYYPHSALELAAVSDLMIGFHTAGMPEAVYAGTPILNLTIPGFHTDLHAKTMHYFDGMFECSGVVTRVPADEAMKRLGDWTLEDFRFDEQARREYLRKFAGPEDAQDGGFASRILEEFEQRKARISQ